MGNDKNKLRLSTDEELWRQTQPNEINPNIGRRSFDGHLLPEGYKFGEGVRPDEVRPVQAEEKSEQRRALDDLYEAAKSRVAEHPGQRRMERAQALVSGIADLGRSIGNLYFTTQSAPNGYKHEDSMSEAQRKRAEKAQAQRDKERAAYYNYAMGIEKLRDGERGFKLKEEQLKLDRDKEERLKVNASLAARKQDWLEKYQKGILDVKREQAELNRLYREGQISKMERDAASNELRAQAAQIRARNTTTETTVHRDARGRETGRTKTIKPGSGASSETATGGGGDATEKTGHELAIELAGRFDAPPSRRRKEDKDDAKTAPSRRKK